MKILKFLLFIFIILASLISLFSMINIKFLIFHVMMFFILLFPYYFWVYSIKTYIITLLVVFVVSIGLLVLTSFSDQSKTKEIKTESTLNLKPKIEEIEFKFDGSLLVYNFTDQSLKRISDAQNAQVNGQEKGNVFKYYYNLINDFIKKIEFKTFKANKIIFLKYILWVLYLILFAFAFSYRPSLVVSYSIILFTLPYALYAGNFLFFGEFTILTNILKGLALVVLLLIGLVRARL